jgi:aryl-alcohol dehydrogenase-like predicted oxidoreductase
VGLSNHDAAALQAASEIGRVDSVQPRFSLVHRAAAQDVLPWCAAHDAGAIVYSPMASGLLTGSFTAERARTLDEDDWRRRSADFTGEGLARNLRLADALRGVADRHGVPVGAVAIAWTLLFPGVSGAIVGARRPQQVDGWVPAAGLRLTPEDLSTIAEALRRWGGGPGPLGPPADPPVAPAGARPQREGGRTSPLGACI